MTKKSFSTVWSFTPDHVHDCAYQQSLFTKEECTKIITLGESLYPEDAKIVATVKNNTTIRDSKVSWIYPMEETTWIYARLFDSLTYLNNQYFKFDLFGMVEGLQFTKYEAPSGHYGQHIDKLSGGIVRKLSITVQLSDPNDYEGGELNLIYDGDPTVISKEQGYLSVFPSYMLHQVQPVTKGTRYSLVCWVSGPPFK
jgi:PKHD-type hydroxylase